MMDNRDADGRGLLKIGSSSARSDRRRRSPRGARRVAVALVLVAVWQGSAAADSESSDGADAGRFPVGSAVHVSRAYDGAPVDATGLRRGRSAAVVEAPAVVTGANGAGLVINPTFDSSITGDPNAADIEAVIQSAIAVYESLFSDPISVSILFRYSTAQAGGKTPLSPGTLALTLSTIYIVPWNVYVDALTADATTLDDATANATLPVSALSGHIQVGSANGRAVGEATAPALLADGTLKAGGEFDSIITLNSAVQFSFTRPPGSGAFDALRVVEHEMDEALGLGSYLNTGRSDLRPQDLFSWSAPGARNLTRSGLRYFSIDGGGADIVGFSQSAAGDFGDWSSGPCPNPLPLVQDAFSCPDEVADVTSMSPEGVNLDVIGYDGPGPLLPTPTSTPTAAATATRTPTSSPSPTRTAPPTPTGTCVGDCGGIRSVSIGNLITLVNIALGNAQPQTCAQGLPSGADVTIALLVQAVNNALNGCAG